jgi:Fe-S-cluster containining protein
MISNDSLFHCTQCGDCCKGFGGTYLGDADIESIAGHIGVSVDEFKQRFCVPSGKRLVLAQGKDGYCIFFSDNCSIHPVKPRMCRRWPFIDNLLIDMDNWHIMANSCPGMRTDIEDDRLHTLLIAILSQKKTKN